ncbi:MAG: AAA family ATPase [Candidatus Kapabacteria bacterium]|nr:AAA family ATPase [Candidatus Kapabacteria bacterium]
MIESIQIKDVASFNNDGAILNNLKETNFIYGANGSGKTSVSRIIANNEYYPESSITWKNNIAIKALVYNKDFISKNYTVDKDLKGIFTLGEENDTIIKDIDGKSKEIAAINEQIIVNNQIIEKFTNKKKSDETKFEESCWKLKIDHDGYFQNAFEGFRNSKQKFKEKCKLENSNSKTLKELDQLKKEADIVFNKNIEMVQDITNINVDSIDSYEKNTILVTKIIGKEDIPIAGLISKLNNSDWVKKGLPYINENNNLCPFCQRPLQEDFKQHIEEYFDETYQRQLNQVSEFRKDYFDFMTKLLNHINAIVISNNQYLDTQLMKTEFELIQSIFERNKLLIDNKVNEPSLVINIESIKLHLTTIKNSIDVTKEKIRGHNYKVVNRKKEESKLISEVWRLIAEINRKNFEEYSKNDIEFQKTIDGVSRTLSENEKKILILKSEINELENQITSIIPSLNAINKLLKGFDFTNFKLSESEKKGFYKIIRENGEEAKDTLSEGETNFISFLYFYYLINGSFTNEDITVNKIVVFDDPVSSLDSNVLFIVSTLIKRIIEEVHKKENLKQVFVLTHNVYFHNKVTQKYNKEKSSFKIIKKDENISRILDFDCNPIRTSYELLWQEVKDYINSGSKSTTILNVLRRIIENYFNILGGYKMNLQNEFEPEELIIYDSLISILHENSHTFEDPLFIESNDDKIDKYLKVFEKIFDKTGHIGHYNMMMKKQSTNQDL